MTGEYRADRATNGQQRHDRHRLDGEARFSGSEFGASITSVEVPPSTEKGDQNEQQSKHAGVYKRFDNIAVQIRYRCLTGLGDLRKNKETAACKAAPPSQRALQEFLPGKLPPFDPAAQTRKFLFMLASQDIRPHDRSSVRKCDDRGARKAQKQTGRHVTSDDQE